MARVYATVEDLAGWLGGLPPVNADMLLTRASLIVDDLLVGVRYHVDEDSMPIHQRTIDALRDATCAQVAWWLAATPGGTAGAVGGCSGADPRLQTFTLTQAQEATPGVPAVGPDVLRVLQVAGLSPSRPWVYG